MTTLEFGVMFTLGLVSSLHCVQMCGPIVLSFSIAAKPAGGIPRFRVSPLFASHLAYNAGRILTYAALGAVAGVLGRTLGLVGRWAGIATSLALVSGVLMILAGVAMLVPLPGSFLQGRFFSFPARVLKPLGGLLSSPAPKRRFVLGLALGFLPCGLVYAALIKAMATGSSLAGAMTMLAFGLGTAGALLALGLFSSAVRGSITRWGRQLAALGVTLMGLVLLWRGTMPMMTTMGGHVHGPH